MVDLKQLEYMIKIADENNITKASEKLFITQSALNQQLLKLEHELGTQLFTRSRNNWHLTEAGKIYVESAKEILRIKKDTYNRINDILEKKEGKLVIGLTPERGTEMFASIYPSFYKKYPNIKIEPLEGPVKQLQAEIAEGNIDIGFLTLQDFQRTKDLYIDICPEEIILGVPKNHPLARTGGKLGERLPTISLTHFEKDPFAVMRMGSTLREIYDKLMSDEELSPPILLETRSCHTLYKMVEEGICCSIFPISYTKHSPDIFYFTINQNPIWKICASYKKGSYLSKAASEFISIAKEYWLDRLRSTAK
jgi:DNA-binding transcriptional LysR family regulator